MDRTFESGAAGSPPSAPASPSTGYPTAGNPSLAVPATKPGPWWYHMMTEELRAVIVAAGLTPDHTDVTQLTQAIQALFVANQKAVVINSATFEASVVDGEVVRWDSANSRFDEAVADGTANNRAVGVADVTNSKVYLYGECTLFSGLTPGARYYLDASTPGAITTTAPTDAVMVGIAKSATTLWVDVDVQPAAGTGSPAGYLNGLTLSNNSGSPNTQVDFAPGVARDSADLYDMELAATMTKTLQASGAFAAGTGNNGLFSGAKANSTWYHCFIIRRDSDGAIDAGFDTSITAANIPSGYSAYRRAGSILTDGSGNIRSFTQAGDEFFWKAPIQDVYTTTLSTASVSYALSVPPGKSVIADFYGFGGAGSGAVSIYIRNPDATDTAAPGDALTGMATISNITGLAETGSGGLHRVATNASSQVAARSSGSSTTLTIWTRGWRDQL